MISDSYKYHLFFSTLANPLRIEIVSSLAESPKPVTELAKELKVEQSKLSHALRALSTCHIVEAEQSGRQRIYSVNKETILPILKLIQKHECRYCKACCGKLEER